MEAPGTHRHHLGIEAPKSSWCGKPNKAPIFGWTSDLLFLVEWRIFVLSNCTLWWFDSGFRISAKFYPEEGLRKSVGLSSGSPQQVETPKLCIRMREGGWVKFPTSIFHMVDFSLEHRYLQSTFPGRIPGFWPIPCMFAVSIPSIGRVKIQDVCTTTRSMFLGNHVHVKITIL